MLQIYKRAAIVHVHLAAPKNSWLAMAALQELGLYSLFGKETFSLFVQDMAMRRNSDKWLSARIDALLDLVNNTWFTRVWVIQEFIAARYVVLHYGNDSILWQDLKTFIEMDTTVMAPLLRSSSSRHGNNERYLGLIQIRWLDSWRTKLKDQETLPLDGILRAFQHCKSEKRIDKVFAFLGLSKAANDLEHLIWVVDWTINRNHFLPISYLDSFGYVASADTTATIALDKLTLKATFRGVLFDHISRVTELRMPLAPD